MWPSQPLPSAWVAALPCSHLDCLPGKRPGSVPGGAPSVEPTVGEAASGLLLSHCLAAPALRLDSCDLEGLQRHSMDEGWRLLVPCTQAAVQRGCRVLSKTQEPCCASHPQFLLPGYLKYPSCTEGKERQLPRHNADPQPTLLAACSCPRVALALLCSLGYGSAQVAKKAGMVTGWQGTTMHNGAATTCGAVLRAALGCATWRGRKVWSQPAL